MGVMDKAVARAKQELAKEQREEASLSIEREANVIAKRANRIAWIAMGVGATGLAVAVASLLFTLLKSP